MKIALIVSQNHLRNSYRPFKQWKIENPKQYYIMYIHMK